MSNRIQVSRIETLPLAALNAEAHAALTDAKNRIRSGKTFPRFENKDDSHGGGPPLPKPSAGCQYCEIQVGAAHPGDDEPKGTRRLVAEFHEKSRQFKKVYYTEEHYRKMSFLRIIKRG